MIKAIIWDIGGVLIDDPKIKNFWGENMKAKDLRNKFGMGRLSKKQFIKEGAKLLDLNEKEFLIKYKKAYFSIALMQEPFNTFKSIKLKKYIFSDSNPIHTEYVKANFKPVLNQVEKAFFSHKIKYRKDDEKSFRLILRKIKLNPSEVIFIDNKKECTDNATKLGMHTILFKNNPQLKRDLAKLGIK